VVYLHRNSSSRLEVLQHLSYLLSLDVSVLLFDLATVVGGIGVLSGEVLEKLRGRNHPRPREKT